MWLTCDCNFFIKLISAIILIFAIVVNGIGNLLDIGDIIETTVHSCYTTEESTTVEESETTTDFITEPTATVATTVESTTKTSTTTTTETTTEPTTKEPTTQCATSPSTTEESTTQPESYLIPQPTVLVFDDQYSVLVVPSEFEGSDVRLAIEPEAEFIDMGDGITGFIGLSEGETYAITVKAIINGKEESSEPVIITVYSPVIPTAPVIESVTSTSVSAKPIENCEYQIRLTNNVAVTEWSDTPVFENLESDLPYYFAVRYKANGYHSAGSEASVTRFTTLPAPTTETTTVTTTEAPTTETTTQKPTTATTKPSTTSTTKTTTRAVTTEAGPYISSAEEISLFVLGGTSLKTALGDIGTVFKAIDSFPDGSYVACGTTPCVDGDFEGLYDSSLNWKTPYSFVAKFTKSGSVEWIKLLGETSSEVLLYDIAVLSNGNIVTVGTVTSQNTGIDSIIYTLSSKGVQLSKNIPTGSGDDFFYSIAATSNGYVVGGKTNSTDGAFEGIPGMSSIVINYDLSNTVLWKRYLNASKSSHIADIDVDDDNNIFFACITTATDGQFAAIEGLIGSYADTVVFKYSYAGDYIWHHVLATTGTDEFDSITADGKGGCLVAGNYTLVSTVIPDGTLQGIHNCGGTDALAIRLDKNGNRLWYKIVSGFLDDFITDVVRTEGGFAVTGYTDSSNREFASIGNSGGTDGFIYFLDVNGTGIEVISQAGSGDDAALCLAYSEQENELLIAGRTKSSDGSFADKNPYTNSMVGYIGRYKTTIG